jgi:hydrogenase expression/formation protein HypD
MKYVDEYRDAAAVQHYVKAIAQLTTRPWTIMEICGGQTHSIVKYGLDTLLPPEITLIHGPGCPVCVTAAEMIARAIALAALPNVIHCLRDLARGGLAILDYRNGEQLPRIC